jgi:hypothetical protein
VGILGKVFATPFPFELTLTVGSRLIVDGVELSVRRLPNGEETVYIHFPSDEVSFRGFADEADGTESVA